MRPKRQKELLARLNQKNPEIEKIKEKILNIPAIQNGINLAKIQIIEALQNKKEEKQNSEEHPIISYAKLGKALAELIREGKLPSSSVIFDVLSGQILVQSFGKGDKIRLQGE